MKDWQEKVSKIAQSITGTGNNELFDAIRSTFFSNGDKIQAAYQIVYDAGNEDKETFLQAQVELERTGEGGISISKKNTIDDIMLKLAYIIVETKVLQEWTKRVKQ